VAVSRGLLAPANFLIDVMRGVPSLKKKNKKKKRGKGTKNFKKKIRIWKSKLKKLKKK